MALVTNSTAACKEALPTLLASDRRATADDDVECCMPRRRPAPAELEIPQDAPTLPPFAGTIAPGPTAAVDIGRGTGRCIEGSPSVGRIADVLEVVVHDENEVASYVDSSPNGAYSFEGNSAISFRGDLLETEVSVSGSNELPHIGMQGSLVARNLDVITDWAVALSTIPFLFLMIPQIITNFQTPGKLAWAGIASGGLGNLLLASFFAAANETKQACIQMIGALTNIFVVVQIFMFKGPSGNHGVPVVPFATLMVLSAIGLVMPVSSMCGTMKGPFQVWLKLTTVIGMGALFFSCANLVTGTWQVHDDGLVIRGAATAAGLLLGMVVLLTGRATDSVGGALATVLFMFMPIPQLVGNLANPAQRLPQFNLAFLYLVTLGNGLGMFRAIFIRNWIWLTGAAWGCFVGGVLLSITCVIGNRQLPEPKFSTATEVLLLSFMSFFILFSLIFLRYDREAQELKRQALRKKLPL